MSSAVATSDQNQHIQVFVRVRPMNGFEIQKHSTSVLDCPGHREVVVKERSSTNLTKTFTFDRAFGPTSTQIDVYKAVVSPLLEEVLLGYNCTVFAYGQTGTGKTFTMEGEKTFDTSFTWENDPLSGIVPRALSQLFDQLGLQDTEFNVRVSLLELYNEELFDLLSCNEKIKTLRLFEDTNRKGSVIIQGLEEVMVHNKHEVYQIMERGSERRKTASTQMNANSSRSHTVFTVTVHMKEATVDGEELLKIGKLNFVDLAGSENIGRSGAVDKRAREAGSINQSLLTLGRVITALVERAPHVPYRESKLTRLLQDSLGGRTKTSIIATVSPASINVEETLSTLDYAHRAKNITNRPEINQKLTKKAMLRAYTEEIERLRRDLVATRDKNGVYLDKDNYEHMLAQIESQGQEVTDKLGQVAALEEAVVKKEEEVAKVRFHLEETKDDLRTANHILAQTQATLSEYEEKLKVALSERDEKESMVQKHVKTEKKLSSEALQLLMTTEETTSHLDKLYRKLERKRAIEYDNLSSGREFSQDLNEQVDSLCTSLELFREDHASFCGVQRLKLDEFLEDKEMAFAEILSDVNGFLRNSAELRQKKSSAVAAQLTTLKSLNSRTGDAITSICEDSLVEIDSFSRNFIIKETTALEAQLSSLRKRIRDTCNSFTVQLSAQSNLVSQYVIQRIKKLELDRKTMEDFLCHQIERSDQAVHSVEKQQARAEKYVQNLQSNVENLMSQCQKMVKNSVSFKAEVVENASCLISNLVESKTDVQTFLNAVRQDFDISKIEIEMLRNNAIEMSDSGTSEANSNMESILSVSTGEPVSYLRGELVRQVEKQKASWEATNGMVSSHAEDWEKSLKQFTAGNDVLEKDEAAANKENESKLRKSLEQGKTKDTDMVTRYKDEMMDHCKKVSKWAEDNTSLVRAQSAKLDEFWNNTYKTDMPTGMTPQKKRYSYPRTLTATTYSPKKRVTICEDVPKQVNGSTESLDFEPLPLADR